MRKLLPIVANQFGTVVLGIIGIKLVSQLVPPTVYGTYALFLTLTQLGVLVTHSGLINHTTRYWQREAARAGAYTRFLWTASWRGGLYLVPIVVLTSVGLVFFAHDPIWLILVPLLWFSNLIGAMTAVANGALGAAEQRWRMWLLCTVSAAARALLPAVLVVLTGASVLALASGFAAHGIIVLLCILRIFRWSISSNATSGATTQQWLTELRDYGRPYILIGIGAWLLQNADRWVVASFFGDEKAGLFALASSIGGMAPALAAGGMLQLVFPSAFRAADSAKTIQDWRRLARRCDQCTVLFIVVTVIGLFVLQWGGPWLVGRIVSEKYTAAMSLVLPAGWGLMAAQVNQFHYLLLQGQHNSADMVKVMVAVAVVKTIGSCVAATVSWQAFVGWLFVSVVVSLWLGRFLIHRIALREEKLPATPSATSLK